MTMAPMPGLALRDLHFDVAEAEVVFHRGRIRIEIATRARGIEDEAWQPRLYHQGFDTAANEIAALAGLRLELPGPGDAAPPGTEYGFLHVFGHEGVRGSTLEFGVPADGHVPIAWSGVADVDWDERFGADVPFACRCLARLKVVDG